MHFFTKTMRLLLILMSISTFALGQRTINGSVLDATTMEPLVGANVVVVTGSGEPIRGTKVDVEGNFTLAIKPSDTQIKVSYTGYNQQVITLTAENVYQVLLTSGNTLEQMVVIGYGSVKRDDVTGSVVSVGAKDFQTGNIATPEQLIAGKVAGVSIISSSGAPGAGSQIRIRGGSSLNASNDPLIVLDGVPLDITTINGSGSALSMINPNDIETFTILKDASATAIYGSRASNGVIIITTKRGAAGNKLSFNFSSVTSLAQPVKFVDMLDTAGFRKAVREKAPGTFQNLPGTSNTDWQREIYRLAVSTDNNFSVRGGTKNLPYRASFGFLDQNGIMLRSNMKRYTAGFSVSPSFMEGKLRFDTNFKISRNDNVFADQGAIGSAVTFDPTQPVRSGNDSYGGYYEWLDNSGKPNVLAQKNPVGLINQKDDLSTVYRSIGNIATDYRFHFLPDLRANLNVGYDISQSSGTVSIDSTAAAGVVRKGIDNFYMQEKRNLLLDFYLNYVKDLKFLNSHLDLMAGYSYQDFIRRDSSIDRSQTGVIFQELNYKTQNTLVSFFGRANYDINSKYLLTLTLRQDGSSRFSPETRWGLFPSAAVAWRINRESFLIGSSVVSDLKLRLGWGVTGQQALPNGNDYPFLPKFTPAEPTAFYPLGGVYYETLRPEGYDANIKWEETTTYNAGLDFGFAKNRITGSLDFYQRDTRDLLATVPVPAGSNLTNQVLTNVGTLQNKGVELSLNSDIIRTSKWVWNLGVNGTYNKNTITKLLLVDDPNFVGIPSGDIGGGVGNKIQINSVGYARGVFFVLEQNYNEDGTPIEGSYKDTNGDGQSTLDDRVRQFQSDPKVFTGLSSTLSRGRWSMGLVARGSFGQYVYDNISSTAGAYQGLTNSTKFLSNLHTSVNETNFSKNQFFSDIYLHRADFVRIDNINIGCNITPITSRFPLRITAMVQNAFVFTKYKGIDPELTNGIDNNVFPRPRTYSVGLNLNF